MKAFADVRSKSNLSQQRIFTDLPAKAVLLEVVIETRDRSHLASTIDALRAANVDVDVGGN
jgi:threonine dehydratase